MWVSANSTAPSTLNHCRSRGKKKRGAGEKARLCATIGVVGDSGDSDVTTNDVYDDGGEVIHEGFSILRANRRNYSAKQTRAAPN